MIDFTRTAHAIGQGGFYSECFERNDKDIFRLIYDCGSETLIPTSKSSKNNFRKIINSDLCKPNNAKANDVDVLVISHFHADHINGIEFLNPRYIVIPLISEEQLLMLWVYSVIHDIDFAIGLESNLRERFPEAQIVKVKSMEDEEYPGNENITDDNGNDRIIESNEPLPGHTLSAINDIWEYRFYNPNLNRFLVRFKNELASNGLNFDKLKGIGSKDYINLHKDVLKAVYRNIGDINEHSLLMYSNAKEKSRIYFKETYQSRLNCYHGLFIDNRCRLCEGFTPCCPGGFYWGDIAVTTSIQSKLHTYLDSLEPVGFIQIPHHGSYNNFAISILSTTSYHIHSPLLCVIQAGTRNKYGHPSAGVVKHIMNQGGIPVIVTEDRSSAFIQSFRLDV